VSVAIRLARHGRTKRPFYRIIVCDKESRRDGRFIEAIGTMDPCKDPREVNLKQDRVKHWVSMGALPSDTVASIINKEIPGYLEELETGRTDKIRSRRAKRKAADEGKKSEKSEAKLKRRARVNREKPEPAKKAAPAEETQAEETPAEETAAPEAAAPEEAAEKAPAEEKPAEE